MAEIPLDVVRDILPYVAAKDLLRFKCVSKLFHSLIDNPDLIKLHTCYSQNSNANNIYGISEYPHIFDLQNSVNDVSQLVLNPPPPTAESAGIHWQVVGSCNGLVALRNRRNLGEFALWNPLTAKFKKLRSYNEPGWYIGTCGFGYDPKCDDYKLVVRAGNDRRVKTAIYSLKTNSWKAINKAWSSNWRLVLCNEVGVLANNALHWFIEQDGNRKIVAFDLVKEEFHCVPISRALYCYSRCVVKLGVLDGCLTVITNMPYNNTWVMKEYGVKKSWTKLVYPNCFTNLSPLTYSSDGNKVLLNQGNNAFVWYDLTSKKMGSRFRANNVSCLKTFKGSLVAFHENIN